MPKVLADNEEVVFQQGVPENPAQIYELLMQAFAEQRRSVIKFVVDGNDALQTGEFADSFELISAESLLHDEIILRLSIDLINQMSTLSQSLSAYQANILTTPWSDVFKQMDAFIQKIQPFADLIDHVMPYAQTYSPPWAGKMKEIATKQATSLSTILAAFENFDPASLSNELKTGFIVIFIDTIKLFETDVIPFLKAEVKSLKEKEESNA
jgi:hypothetical protein